MQFWKTHIFPNSNKIAINPNKIIYLIYIFFLQYFIYFGEVILSPLIYFDMKYFQREKLIKTKMILVSIFDKIQIWKRWNPQLSPRVLGCLEFQGSQNGNAIKYDMHEWPMYNIPNWKFGMLQTYPP